MHSKFLFLVFSACALVNCTPHHTPGRPAGGFNKPTREALSPFTYLRKLSLHIRGEIPDRAEYEALTRAIEKNNVRDFLHSKINSYLGSDQHIDKMSFRLEELLSLRASRVPFYSSHLKNPTFDLQIYTVHNAMNEMFRQIVSRNLSWDTLLNGKHYTAYPDGEFVGDLPFFATAAGTPSISNKPIAVNFPPGDARVAGVITTDRFFSRYVNTALNKNRRRAAAVFRAFLCDDMKAVVVSEKGNEEGILDKVFPGPGHHGKGLGDIHGSEEACMKCHEKLDPMGKTFQASGMVLAPLASPGALVFTSSSGKKVDIPVKGLGELAEAIVKQDDYVRCQMKHFWDWYIGEDKKLDENTLRELSAKFNQVGRKTNDFIAYLVERPEFGLTEVPGANGPLITEVKSILKNCIGCHDTEGLPRFTEWPIGGDEAKHASWIARIRRSLSLDGSNRPRSMPPAKSVWQPSPAQLATIQQWLDLGAPNE